MSAKQMTSDLLRAVSLMISRTNINQAHYQFLTSQSARDLVYQDLYHIGYTIFTADQLGQHMELVSLADLLTGLDIKENHADFEKVSAALLKKIEHEISQGIRREPALPEIIQFAQVFDKEHHTEHTQDVTHLFNAILNEFIIHDGQVSTQEISVMRAYEALWPKETNSQTF